MLKCAGEKNLTDETAHYLLDAAQSLRLHCNSKQWKALSNLKN